ncbi:MAG: crossover junction endodeoxyribonuclease RuvC [Bdellovibrionota bacterium]
MRVLGIDPGSNFLGLGCVEAQGSSFVWIGQRLLKVNPGGEQPLHVRLKLIHEGLLDALSAWNPDAVAVEEVFLAKNAQSALKLGQARGAALVGAAALGLEIFEYPASLVKQTVTGSGRAEKAQVQTMVRAILGRTLPAAMEFEREDISDALAIAICHLQHRRQRQILHPKTAKKLGPRAGL